MRNVHEARGPVAGVVPLGVVLLGLAVMAAACGADGNGPAAGGDGPAGNLALEAAYDPDPPRSGDPVGWTLRVRNHGDEAVTITFSSGKSGDVVLSRDGTEMYRWSSDRFFTEAVRQETVAPGDERMYRLDEPTLSVEPGTYDLVATLAGEPAPEPVRRRLEVE